MSNVIDGQIGAKPLLVHLLVIEGKLATNERTI